VEPGPSHRDDVPTNCPICKRPFGSALPHEHLRIHGGWRDVLKSIPVALWLEEMRAESQRIKNRKRASMKERKQRGRKGKQFVPPRVLPPSERPPEPWKDAPKYPVIRLKARKGTFVGDSPKTCSRCQLTRLPTWRYEAPDGAEVFLCNRCEARVLEKNFGKVDAMTRTLPGGFGQGRRR